MTEARASDLSSPRSGLSRPLVGLVFLLALLIAGCGSSSDGDSQLAVYVSAPLSGPRAAEGQDVVDGAMLALDDAGGEAGGVAVSMEPLDDATDGGWDAAATGANARRATEDTTTIAYIGELDSGASRTSIPITNEAGILQVSAGAGAEDLTRDGLGSSDIPSVQPSGTRSFGRVIPSDRAQGEAAAGWMSADGVETVELVSDDSDYAAALQSGIEAAPSGPAIVEGGGADAFFIAAADLPGSLVSAGAGERRIYASDAQLEDTSGLSSRSNPVRVVSAALDPTQLPPAADDFLAAFRAAYGRKPGRYAAYGYEAMAVVLDSIDRADDPLARGSVTNAFFDTSDRESILGTYSIDGVGNTTLAELGAYEISGTGRPKPLPEPLQLP